MMMLFCAKLRHLVNRKERYHGAYLRQCSILRCHHDKVGARVQLTDIIILFHIYVDVQCKHDMDYRDMSDLISYYSKTRLI